MSLLLDALKKAASDKEKIKSEQNKEVIGLDVNVNAEIEAKEDLDLDLDIVVDDALYPEIDEDVLMPDEARDTESVLDTPSIIDAAVELEQPDIEEVQEVQEVVEVVLPEKEVENKQAEKFEPSIQPIVKKDYGVKNKEALSELINKSNQYSRRKALKTRIIIASTVAAVFFLAAIYLYFEFAAESQNIYVADENNLAAVRDNSSARKEESAQQVAKEIKDESEINIPNVDNSKVKTSRKKSIERKTDKKQQIKVEHKTKKDPTESLVQDAYAAFNRGDFKTSEQLYMKVITEEPKNRDALMGLAAIAVKQHRYEYARQKYMQLRHLNPRDSIALAGLSSIQNKVDPELKETELNYMLREQPESAHLYYALGSLYASQKKWAEAQAAFFSAWSAENTNADYAFNLAVSLDQLGKKTQARQMYELSLKLSNTRQGNFSKETVEKRIKSLIENND